MGGGGRVDYHRGSRHRARGQWRTIGEGDILPTTKHYHDQIMMMILPRMKSDRKNDHDVMRKIVTMSKSRNAQQHLDCTKFATMPAIKWHISHSTPKYSPIVACHSHAINHPPIRKQWFDFDKPPEQWDFSAAAIYTIWSGSRPQPGEGVAAPPGRHQGPHSTLPVEYAMRGCCFFVITHIFSGINAFLDNNNGFGHKYFYMKCGVLLRYRSFSFLRPVRFFSRSLSNTQCADDVYFISDLYFAWNWYFVDNINIWRRREREEKIKTLNWSA